MTGKLQMGILLAFGTDAGSIGHVADAASVGWLFAFMDMLPIEDCTPG